MSTNEISVSSSFIMGEGGGGGRDARVGQRELVSFGGVSCGAVEVFDDVLFFHPHHIQYYPQELPCVLLCKGF